MVWYFQLVIHPVSILRAFQYKFVDYTIPVQDYMSTVLEFILYIGYWRNFIVQYGTYYSASAEVYVAYVSPGYLPGPDIITRVLVRI